MEINGFSPPDYGLIDEDPLGFKQQLQAFVDAITAYQSDAGDLERTNAELHAALDQKTRQLQEVEQLGQQHEEAAKAMAASHDLAVAAYRQAVLNGDPTIPPALVEGRTVGEIDAALEQARGVVEYVRERVMAGKGYGGPGPITPPAAPPRVPAGAPGRTLPDVSAMSPREKLIFGTQRAG